MAQPWQPNHPFAQRIKTTPAPSSAPAAKVIHSRLAGFGIPFKIDDQSGKFIEVQLYASSNQGRNWEFTARQPVNGTEFPFRASGEGEYWFALKTLDRNRRLLPEGKAQPELKIIVDTTRPELDFTVTTDRAGRVVCRWQAADQYLDSAATRLQYRTTQVDRGSPSMSEPAWQDVALARPTLLPTGTYRDQIAFWPDTETNQLELRMAVADQAGNFAVANRTTQVSRPAWRHSTRATARPNDRPAVDPSNVDVTGRTEAHPSDATAWKQAFYSKLRSQEQQLNRSAQPAFVQTQPPQTARPYQPPRVRTTPAAQAALARSANQRNGVPAKLIGSAPEYAAPPVPKGWVVPAPNQALRPVVPEKLESFTQPPAPQQTVGQTQFPENKFPQTQFPQNRQPIVRQPTIPKEEVDVWQSAVHRDENETRESISSTNQPSRAMLPLPQPSRRSPGPADQVAANEATFRTSGDQAIGSSSTQWPRNQYQGLASAPPAAQTLPVPSEIFQPQPQSTTGTTFRNASAPFSNSQIHQKLTSATASANTGRPSASGPTNANTQIISTKRFRLKYDIDAIDPSGVGKVDLWMTRDQGRSWQLWGSDPDNKSPFPVEVEQEGLFGFRIVIHSREGLAGIGPSSGDDADMWVRIDTQSPLAQITSVPYGRGKEAGRLVIHYRVADPFLTLRPVRLSYSRSPQGPWTIIEDDLRNEGRYVWKVHRAVPDRIFLKIDALDSAGNVGTHLLPQAIDVSGLVPRGTIHTVEPVGR